MKRSQLIRALICFALIAGVASFITQAITASNVEVLVIYAIFAIVSAIAFIFYFTRKDR